MEPIGVIQSALALIFVLALIGLTSYLIRRYGTDRVIRSQVSKGGDKRLQITDMMMLDGKRRLFLIKRDDVEHLLLLGMDGETVVESNIKVKAGGGK